MKRDNYRYSGYRGRATTTDKLRVVAVALLVLVLLALAALLIGQRYIVYTDDGIRLELPFLNREEPKQNYEDLEQFEVVVEPTEPERPEEKPAVSEPEEEQIRLNAVVLPLETVLDGTAAERARQLGANTIVLDMKTDQGQLGYRSDLPLAQQMGTNHPSQEINDRLGELSGGEFHLVARISCFRDHMLAGEHAYAIRSNSDYRWVDYSSVRWSSPANSQVRDYLTGIMMELARLGFDEILLDNWGYPGRTEGELGYIKQSEAYRPEELDVPVTLFLQTAGQALKNSGAVLSLCADEAVLSGGTSGGKTAAHLIQIPERIWLKAGDDRAEAILQLEDAGMEDVSGQLVEAVETLEGVWEDHRWLNTEI